MDLTDVTPENFFKKVTYISDTNPGSKLKINDGIFVQCAIHLRLIQELQRLSSEISINK